MKQAASVAVAAPYAKPSAKKSRRRSGILSIAVMTLAVPGLFATIALPAYAYSPDDGVDSAQASVALEQYKAADAQTVFVATGVEPEAVARDAFTATTHAELEQRRLELERRRLAAVYAAYSGPRTADFLKNPPYPSFSLDQVVAVAKQYTGVPYRYGGADPSGFDCSGFTQFVYAQFGVSLPHSATAQGRLGTRISRADARPGDLVVMSDGSHVGIYTGGNSFIDAPKPGGSVGVRPIWTDSYFIVRVGI